MVGEAGDLKCLKGSTSSPVPVSRPGFFLFVTHILPPLATSPRTLRPNEGPEPGIDLRPVEQRDAEALDRATDQLAARGLGVEHACYLFLAIRCRRDVLRVPALLIAPARGCERLTKDPNNLSHAMLLDPGRPRLGWVSRHLV
jgi:hypothetical protein